MNGKIIQGDANKRMGKIESNKIDLLLSDPPYGYSFMGKDWDKALPSINIWKECLRVLKPGSFAFVMSAPRQDVMSRMIVNLEDAGFVTNFTPIFWTYPSGFPKAANISKLVDKKLGKKRKKKIVTNAGLHDNRNLNDDNWSKIDQKKPYKDDDSPVSEQAKKLNGAYAGFQPKPAVEVILVAMKPMDRKSYVEQAMENGKGITWFDDCRIPYLDKKDMGDPDRFKGLPWLNSEYGWNKNDLINNVTPSEKGRFPANLLASDDSLNNGQRAKDGGSFSKYFDLDKWHAQFIITSKPSRSEKERGLGKFAEKNVTDGRKHDPDVPFQRGKTKRKNTHPTVKPISLMKYLVMMGSRENDTVLDPFLGSGTTGIACELLARNWIGIELNKEYVKIARARLKQCVKDRRDGFA